MRIHLIAIAAAAALSFPIPAFAQGIHIGPGGVHVDNGYGYRAEYQGGRCRELRRACMHKHELGEEGEGNCARYRHFCR